MATTETVRATDAASAAGGSSRLDEQLAKLEGHLQDLLREGRAAPPAPTSPSPQTEPLSERKHAAETKPSTAPALPPLAPPAAPRRGKAARMARLAVGVGLLALAAWALAPLIFELRSTSARVNAPILTLRSPIDGTVKFDCPTTSGAAATASAPLFEIKNSLADEDRVDSLKDEEAYLQSRISGARRQLTGLTKLQEGLSSTAGEYRAARLRILQMDCEAAQAALENARAVKKQRDFEEQQLAQLQASRTISKQDASAAHFAAEAAGACHGAGREERREAARTGPLPPRRRRGRRRRRRLALHYATAARARHPHRGDPRDALAGRGEAGPAPAAHPRGDRAAVAPRAVCVRVAPEQSVVWRRRVGNDTPIQADSPLLDLVNPSEVFIDAVIGESDLKRVQCGGRGPRAAARFPQGMEGRGQAGVRPRSALARRRAWRRRPSRRLSRRYTSSSALPSR